METSEVTINLHNGESMGLLNENDNNIDLQEFMEFSFAITIDLYFSEGGKVEDIKEIIFTWKS